MESDSIESIVAHLNGFPWGSADRIDEEADALARQHVASLTAVIERVGRSLDLDVHEAYSYTQSAGHDSPRHKALTHALFKMNALAGLSHRVHIILAITSYYCWNLDPDFAPLENPWQPVMSLYAKGYQTTFEELEHPQALELIFIAKSDRRVYRVG